MKRCLSRLLSLLLAAAMLPLPAALALDTVPPMYEQLGYSSPEEMMEAESFDLFDYGQASDSYRRHLEEIQKNPKLALDYWGFDSMEELDESISDWGEWENRGAFYRWVALSMAQGDEMDYRPPVSVQLSGEQIAFPDAQPEAVDGRTMAPFRAVAEAMGAEVGYAAQSGGVTAVWDGKTYEFGIGSSELVISDAETGKKLRTVELDVAPYLKNGRTYVPVRFFAEAFGLTVQWDSYRQTAVLYDRAALAAQINKDFTIVNEWLAAQPEADPAQAMRTAASIAVVFTELNSIDGDERYQMDGTLEIVSQGVSMEADLRLDLRALLTLLRSKLDGAWYEDLYGELLDTVEKLVSEPLTFRMILDAEQDNVYLYCPQLIKLVLELGGDNTEDLPEGLAPTSWLKLSGLFGELESITGSFDALRERRTIGELVVTSAEQDAARFADGGACFDTWSTLWESAQLEAGQLRRFMGDALFTRRGARCTAEFRAETAGEEDDWFSSGTEMMSGSYTLDLSTGSVEGEFSGRESAYWSDTLMSVRFSADSSAGEVHMTLHEKNKGILEISVSLRQTASPRPPVSEPPAGAQVIDLTGELLGGAEPEPPPAEN